MPLPVIENCFRVTWLFETYQGVTPRIVNHFLTASADVQQLGDGIWNSVSEGMFGPMNENFEPTQLAILPLDGVHATEIIARDVIDPPQLCLSSGQILPSTAAVVSLRTTQRGSRGRGRAFVGPCCEQDVTDGFLVGDSLTNPPIAWGIFGAALQTMDPEIALAVASYVHEEAFPVNGISMRSAVGTQRRRQNQLVV